VPPREKPAAFRRPLHSPVAAAVTCSTRQRNLKKRVNSQESTSTPTHTTEQELHLLEQLFKCSRTVAHSQRAQHTH